MSAEYKYKFVSGKLIKTDIEGNELSTVSLSYSPPTRTTSSANTSQLVNRVGSIAEQAASAIMIHGPTRSVLASDNMSNKVPQAKLASNSSINAAQSTHGEQDSENMVLDDPQIASQSTANSSIDQPTFARVESGLNQSMESDQPDATSTFAEEETKAKTLAARDEQAIEYSQNILDQGDTLVYILYPGNAFDVSGFCVSDIVHRVHSEKLLSTGSLKFKALLGPAQQYRTLRKKHINLVNKLPPGIKYVLDLTPPDEGDEAVDLTASLSCSYGISQWYSAQHRIHVSPDLVAGKDEFLASHDMINSYGGLVSSKLPRRSGSNENNIEHHSFKQSHIDNNFPTARETSTTTGLWPTESTSPEPPKTRSQADRELAQALRASTADVVVLPSVRKHWKYREVPEYDSIRHRTGIVRLLQFIEGKSPKLDSAPKMWTVLALAQYFGCVDVVRDDIISWLMADPNTKFIEILPEVACKIGFQLQSPLIARASFAILVGEEALSLVARAHNKTSADRRGTNQFGRRRDGIDEDLMTRLEYASRSFMDNINAVFRRLMDKQCTYFEHSDQWKKLENLRQAISSVHNTPRPQIELWLNQIVEFRDCLRQWVRGRILRTLTTSLSHDLNVRSNRNRLAEDYGPIPSIKSMEDIYSSLSTDERLMTVLFWHMLRDMQLISIHGWEFNRNNENTSHTNLSFGDAQCELLARVHGVTHLTLEHVIAARDTFNKAVLQATFHGYYNDGVIPRKCFPSQRPMRSTPVVRYQPDGEQGSSIPVAAKQAEYLRPKSTASSHAMSSDNASMTARTRVAKYPASQPYGNPHTALPIREYPEASQLLPVDATGVPSVSLEQQEPQSIDARRQDLLPQSFSKSKSEDLPYRVKSQSGTKRKSTEEEQFDVLLVQNVMDKRRAMATDIDINGTLFYESRPTARQELRQKAISFITAQTANQGLLVSEPPAPDRCFVRPDSQFVETNDQYQVHSNVDEHVQAQTNMTQRKDQELHDTIRLTSATVPDEAEINSTSIFFNLDLFMEDVQNHIEKVCNNVLSKGDLNELELTDTLVCLSNEQWKFLPLWAGGDDDGTGGVFNEDIPTALAGPSGPGPAFHTGFSIPSAPNSIRSFDGGSISCMTSVNTSEMVEDGYSDALPRGKVVSYDGSESETFSADEDMWNGVGKGKAPIYPKYSPSSLDDVASAADTDVTIDDDAMSYDASSDAGTETGFDVVTAAEAKEDGDDEWGKALNNDPIDIEDEDDDMFDAGDDETFDFGDGNDNDNFIS